MCTQKNRGHKPVNFLTKVHEVPLDAPDTQPLLPPGKDCIIYRLLIKNFEFYFPFFYYCLMTSAYFIRKLQIFYYRFLGIPKDDKTTFSRNL